MGFDKTPSAPHAPRTPVRSNTVRTWLTVLLAGIALAAVIGVPTYFLLQPGIRTDHIRDIFIVIAALMLILLAVALVVLLIQLAMLINLLQNELRPIIDDASETVSTLKGTVQFLGENAVRPVIKLNGYMAGAKAVLELLGIGRK